MSPPEPVAPVPPRRGFDPQFEPRFEPRFDPRFDPSSPLGYDETQPALEATSPPVTERGTSYGDSREGIPGDRAPDLVRSLVTVLGRAIVRPVREGLWRANGPVGLRPAVLVGLVAYAVGAVVVLLGSTIRVHSDLTAVGSGLSVPRWPLLVVQVLVVVGAALLVVACLHLPMWPRVAGLLLAMLMVLRLGVSAASEGSVARPVAWWTCLVLAVFAAVRWRAAFVWWELPVALTVVGGSVALMLRAVAVSSQTYGADVVPLAATLLLGLVSALAVPVVVVAGLAYAQVAVRLAAQAAEVARGRRAVVVDAVLLVVVARVALTVRHVVYGGEALAEVVRSTGAAVVVAGVVLVALVVALVVAARSRGDATSWPTLDALDDALPSVALPAAGVLGATAVLGGVFQGLGSVLHAYQATSTNGPLDLAVTLAALPVVAWSWVLGGLLLLGYAVAVARRGGGHGPAGWLLTTVAGTVVLWLGLAQLGGLSGASAVVAALRWTPDAVGDVASTVVVLILASLAATGRLTEERLLTLGTAVAVTLLWGVRDVLDAPLTALLRVSAAGTVLLGLTWALLTARGSLLRGSTRLPATSRVLLVVAAGVLGVAALAFATLTRMAPIGADLGQQVAVGDAALGTALMLAAVTVLVAAALRRRPPS